MTRHPEMKLLIPLIVLAVGAALLLAGLILTQRETPISHASPPARAGSAPPQVKATQNPLDAKDTVVQWANSNWDYSWDGAGASRMTPAEVSAHTVSLLLDATETPEGTSPTGEQGWMVYATVQVTANGANTVSSDQAEVFLQQTGGVWKVVEVKA